MEFIPDYHLEEWDEIEENVFEKENLRIAVIEDRNVLYIKDKGNTFREIKDITNYWEYRSLDMFLNTETNGDQDNYEYQHDFFMYIRDNFQHYDYLVFDKSNNQVYGHNGLFDVDNKWADQEMKQKYKDGKVFIVDVSYDILPLCYDEGWKDIDIMSYKEAVVEHRDKKISEVLNI